MKRLGLVLFVSFLASACGQKLQPKYAAPSLDEPSDMTGMTPTQNLVHGTTVDAKISVTPSAQVVRGLAVGARISVQ